MDKQAGDDERRRMQKELHERREAAVKLITRKNRLLIHHERLTAALADAVDNSRPAIETQLAELEPLRVEAIADVERVKVEMRKLEEQVRTRTWEIALREYPPENRDRARVVIEQRERTLQDWINKPTEIRELYDRITFLRTEIQNARDGGNDVLAVDLARDLDQLLRRAETESDEYGRVMQDLRQVTAPFDEELERLR